jgi:zinc transport system permease protein
MRVTGLIMVIAMLAIPPAIAEMFTSRLWRMMVLASLLSAVFSIAGLLLATMLDLPPGAVIILISAACYAVSLLVDRARSGLA